MPFNFVTNVDDMLRERRNDMAAVAAVEQNKLAGRINRPGRAVPANAADVIPGDMVGDVMNDATYSYTLRVVSLVPLWDRQTMDVGW